MTFAESAELSIYFETLFSGNHYGNGLIEAESDIDLEIKQASINFVT